MKIENWIVLWYSFNEEGNIQVEKIYSCSSKEEAAEKYKECTKIKKYGWGP